MNDLGFVFSDAFAGLFFAFIFGMAFGALMNFIIRLVAYHK